MNILLVEDNLSIIKGLSYSFEVNKYKFNYVMSVNDTINYLDKNSDIDLIILDVCLPDGNGFDLYKDYIKNLNIPVLFLTARDEEDDIVRGLELGADDYITKPFSTKELMARINKILLRNGKNKIIKIKDISYDLDKMILKKNNCEIVLSALELKLINLLFTNVNKVVSRGVILDKIWEWTGNDVDSHTITVYLKRIREKLGEDIITTVKGIGYRIDGE